MSRPRTPGFFYAILSFVLVVLLAAIALTVNAPPPQTIAEFAPQAVENIVDAPSDQASAGRGAAGPTPTPTPDVSAPETIEVPRTRKCVGEPPRQIEDPQSPPCVPYWVGDNGGSTWRGVTRDTITVAFARPHGDDYDRDLDALSAFFNKRFEFYGRRLLFEAYESAGEDNTSSAEMVADAVKVEQEIGAFAAQGYDDRAGNESTHYDELARRKILSVAQRPSFVGEDHRTEFAPYQWTYLPGADVAQKNVGEWICGTVAGRNAEWAAGPQRGRPRVFGVWRHYTPDRSTADTKTLDDRLAACNAKPVVYVEAQEPGEAGSFSQEYRNSVLRLQSEGVTSVICVCRAAALVWSGQPATAVDYFPEWLVSSWIESDDDYIQTLRPQPQRPQTFGLSFWSKRQALESAPCQQATRETDPSFEWPARNSNLDGAYLWCLYIYEPMLLLASGIQMAGPNLTPTSFQQGLFRTRFPNPSAGAAPYWQASVDFAAGDRVMNDDANVIWWSETQQSHLTGRSGRFCYYNRGERWGSGSWPSGRQALFEGECD